MVGDDQSSWAEMVLMLLCRQPFETVEVVDLISLKAEEGALC